MASPSLDRALDARQQGRLVEAEGICRQMLSIASENVEAWHLLSVIYLDSGRNEEAVTCCEQALKLKPGFVEALYNLGSAQLRLRRATEALAAFESALQIRPDVPDLLNNYGSALRELGRAEEARAQYLEAIRLQPQFAFAWHNLGIAWQDLDNLDEALACFERALLLEPRFVEPHYHRAMIWLLRGDFAQGWREYEWRPGAFNTPFTQPRWDGSPLAGRTILLQVEQGLGDALQFVRYAPLVQARGGRTLLWCHRHADRLLACAQGIDLVIPDGDLIPTFDLQIPLLSLANLFATTLKSIPTTIPYLLVPEAAKARWAQRLAGIEGRRIGIAWQGNPDHTNDRRRSVPLARFAPLAAIEGTQLIVLQKGVGREQLGSFPGPLLDLAGEYGDDLLETAALMSQLDLIITIDSMIAHLAGALGLPCWLLLPRTPDWRWLLDRDDSPWYPTLRLFRGDWDHVFAKVVQMASGNVSRLILASDDEESRG